MRGAAGRQRLGDAAQHRQHVRDQDAARRGRRVGDDLAAAVVGHPQRPPPDRPVGGQVGHRQPPAGRRAGGRPSRSRGRRRRSRARPARPAARSCRPGRAGARARPRARTGRRARTRPAPRACARARPGSRRAPPAGRRSRRRPHSRPLRRASADRATAATRSGRARRRGPATTPGTAQAAAPMWNTCVVCSSNGTSTASGSPSGRSARQVAARDGRERVEQVHLARAGGPHQQEAASARADQPGLGRPRHRRGGDGGIDRVSALGEDGGGGAGGLLMSGGGGGPHAGIVRVTPLPVADAGPGRAARSDMSRSRRPRSAPCASAR